MAELVAGPVQRLIPHVRRTLPLPPPLRRPWRLIPACAGNTLATVTSAGEFFKATASALSIRCKLSAEKSPAEARAWWANSSRKYEVVSCHSAACRSRLAAGRQFLSYHGVIVPALDLAGAEAGEGAVNGLFASGVCERPARRGVEVGGPGDPSGIQALRALIPVQYGIKDAKLALNWPNRARATGKTNCHRTRL